MNKRIFTSFAVEDQRVRDLLVGQARNESTPFEFVDMSVKEPWDSRWKSNCRSKIKGCDGMIALLSRNTMTAEGARWELSCAREEAIPVIGVYPLREGRLAPDVTSGTLARQWRGSGSASPRSVGLFGSGTEAA
jgi:hypothetical protein